MLSLCCHLPLFNQFKGFRLAIFHTQGISAAHVTLVGLFILANLNHLVRAGFNTVAATGAGLFVNQHNPCCLISADGIKGAGMHAKRIFALCADQRPVNQVLVFTENFK